MTGPQLLDLVTPAAALLIPPGVDYDDPDVRDIRRGGIHGSDVAAILGVTKRGSARGVWHEKHDGVHVDLHHLAEAARWGNLHEPTVAAEWARRHNLDVMFVQDVGTLVNVNDPWMRAQVDRLLYACPDDDSPRDVGAPTCSLEIKCRSAWVASRWVDDVPDDVLAQVAWQRIVTGLDHVHVACLIDGNRLVEHRYDRDEQLEDMLVTEAGALWDRVLSHDPPDMAYDDMIKDLLEKLFPDRAGERELTPSEYGELLGPWQVYVKTRTLAAELKAAASGRILEALAGAEVLTFGGAPVWSYKQVDATDVAAYRRKAYRALRGPS